MIGALLSLLLLAAPPALAPQEEDRANALMSELRCVVCEGQPISESEAGIAQDMRLEVREQVAAGRSDDEIRDWMAERYGEGVLLRPRFSSGGAPLWIAPLAFLLLAGLIVAALMRGGGKSDREES